jgi:hypothetical protein
MRSLLVELVTAKSVGSAGAMAAPRPEPELEPTTASTAATSISARAVGLVGI